MQTFLPSDNFAVSARLLDRQRLGKQRVEAWQILNTLTGKSKGWANHPAVKMWQGHEAALCEYGIEMCLAWRARGYKDTLMLQFLEVFDGLIESGDTYEYPDWLGDRSLHASHRSNLLRKDLTFYSQHGWTETDDMPYVWPV